MLKVALTGGIASGKSYVLGRLRALGVPAIDADSLVHRALSAGSAASREIAARFGASVVAPDGGIDRKALGRIVFEDAEARRALEAILHPEVYRSIQQWMEQARQQGASLAVADIPLLFETDHQADFDRVVVTFCPPELQVQRIIARDGLTPDDARLRLAAQWPIEEKARRADFIIRTDVSFEDTDRQVAAVLRALQRLEP